MGIKISETLARLRAEKGLTQEEVAHHLGITKAAVSKWECGQSLPDIALLPAIASLYSTSVDDLLGCAHELDEAAINGIYQKALALFGEDPEAGLNYVRVQARDNWGRPKLLRLLGAALLAQIPALPGFNDGALEGESLACAKEAERVVRRTMELSSDETASLTEVPALTRILMWTDRQAEAERLLEGRVKKEPNLQAPLLAQLHAEAGREEAAVAVLQRALLIALLEAQTTMASLAPHVDDAQLSELAQLACSLQCASEYVSLFPTLMPTIRLQQAKNLSRAESCEDALATLERFADALDEAGAVMLNPVNPAIFDKVQDMMWAEADAAISKARSESVASLRAAYAAALATDDVWMPLRDDERFARIVVRVSGNAESR